MTDFFDLLERQLVVAERELAMVDAAVAVVDQPRRRRRHRVSKRRAGALVVAVGLVAGPAVAAVQPWNAVFGRAELHDAPQSTAASAVPRDEVAVLGILRRPQTAQDRMEAESLDLLRSVGVEYRGVRADSVRVVASGSNTVAVFSSEHVGGADGAGPDDLDDVVCFTTTSGGTCGDAKTLMSGKLMLLAGHTVMGLAPDGVQDVVLRYADGPPVAASVNDNFFSTQSAPTTTTPSTGRTPAASVSQMPTDIDWLDADGKRLGPIS